MLLNKKILILGAKGMLGQRLAEVFAESNPILYDLADLDITNEDLVKQKIDEIKPSLIINAAAYTDVDGCETNQELANKVNGLAVGYVAAAAKAVGAVLVHYSTDYVFDGNKPEGYMESDKPNPINTYGRSKLLGEKLLQKSADQFYLIRTSWLYGPGGKNFIDTILTLASKQNMLKVVNDQWGKPTYTIDLAKATRQLVEQNKPFGVYHMTNATQEGGITWHEFAKKAVELKGLNTQVVPCTTADFPRPAKRPAHSALINTNIEPLRSWGKALEDYLKNYL